MYKTYPGETPDLGLPERMMAAPGVVTSEGIIFGADVSWRWCFALAETPDLGLPDRTMATRDAALPAGGIIFGADRG
jgi:hypothetical protein